MTAAAASEVSENESVTTQNLPVACYEVGSKLCGTYCILPLFVLQIAVQGLKFQF
jgi:hypothetical protein